MIDLRALHADAARARGDVMDGFRPGASADELLRQHDAVPLHLHTTAVACPLAGGDAQSFERARTYLLFAAQVFASFRASS